MMMNNDNIHCFCVGRYEIIYFSWFIGGIVTWRKTKTNVLILQELLYNCFFSLFQIREGVVKGNADSRFTNQLKVIHTEKIKLYLISRYVFLKNKSLLELFKIL